MLVRNILHERKSIITIFVRYSKKSFLTASKDKMVSKKKKP